MTSRLSTSALLLVTLFVLSPAPGGAREPAEGNLGAPLVAVERAVQNSTIVVEGAPRRFIGRSSRAEFRVMTTLKGEPVSGRLIVDFEKAPYGIWPRLGEQALLCLSKTEGGRDYELASYCAGVLPATEPVRSAIRAMLALKVDESARATTETREGVTEGTVLETSALPRVELADVYADRVVESETILVGALTGVRPSRDGFVGTFKVEKPLLGYARFKEPVRVDFAGRPGLALRAAPAAGRYVMFLRGSDTGDGFDVVSGDFGAVRPAGAEEEKKIERAVEALVEFKYPSKPDLTTVQATVVEWQDSWNSRDLARCMRCYSSQNALRKEYEAGGQRRSSLEEQIKSYPGEVGLSIQRVERQQAFSGGGETATVTALLTLAGEDIEDKRMVEVKMKFVREEGEWLILEEGF